MRNFEKFKTSEFMKKIEIRNFHLPDKSSIVTEQRMYRISLDFGQSASFKSLKEIQKFIVDTNAMLNDVAFELDYVGVAVIELYRKAKLYDMKTNCNQLIFNAFECLDRAYKGNSSENENYLIFADMKRAINTFNKIIDLVLEYIKDKRLYDIQNGAIHYAKRLNEMYAKCNDWAKK